MFKSRETKEVEATIMSTLSPGQNLDVSIDFDGFEFIIHRKEGDGKEVLAKCTPADGMLIMMCLSHMYGKKMTKAILNFKADRMWRSDA